MAEACCGSVYWRLKGVRAMLDPNMGEANVNPSNDPLFIFHTSLKPLTVFGNPNSVFKLQKLLEEADFA